MEIELPKSIPSSELKQADCLNSQDMFVMRETHKYIFYGPSRKDVKNTYFEAVYLFEKKLRIQAGQKVVLGHNKEVYGVALVGQAQNRQVWVWLVSFQTEDVVKRLIVQVADIVGSQSSEEQDICRNALARYQRKSANYRNMLGNNDPICSPLNGSSTDSEPGTPIKGSPATRRLRSQVKPEGSSDERPKRAKRSYNRYKIYDDEEEEEDAFDEIDLDDDEEEENNYKRRSSPKKQLNIKRQRIECGELFMTLLECVVMTLEKEYPDQS